MPTCRSVLRYWVRLAVIGSMLQAGSACGDNSTAPSPSPETEGEPTLAIVSGDGQSAEVASPLPQPLVVVLRGSRRAPIAGVLVRFVDENGVVGDSVLTDSRGSASARWTLGPKAKTQRISAVATISRGDTNTVADTAFTATALAGPAAQIRLHTTADIAAPGSPLDTVVAIMTDRFENRVPYAVIAWIVELGGGSVRALTPKTDVDGVARALWTLGAGTGENVLVVTSGPLATRLKGFASVGFPATSIVVGEEHACALTPLGATYCWGSPSLPPCCRPQPRAAVTRPPPSRPSWKMQR